MKRMARLSDLWNHQSITIKYSVGISVLLLLILIVSVTGYFSLRYVRAADAAIYRSTEIQRLVFDMDRGLEQARHLHGQFFLYYPRIGLKKAHETYAQSCVRKIAQVVSTSELLRDMITRAKVSDALRGSDVDLNLFLSSAKRFADTSIESFELATRLAVPEEGLEATLDRHLAGLADTLPASSRLSDLYHEMERLIHRHRLSRERFVMQAAFNAAFRLRGEANADPSIDQAARESIHTYLDRIKDTAEEILNIDVAIDDKYNDFILQEKAASTASEKLIDIARTEVKKAQQVIVATHRLAAVILGAVTVVGLIAAAGIAFLLNNNITRRVIQLTGAAEALENGRLDVRAEEGHLDELGKLGRTFNYMTRRLKTMVDRLEQEVRDRTRELSDANESLQNEIQERGQAEERFRMAAEAMSDLIYEWDVENGALTWYGDIDGALGYDPQEFPRDIGSWISRIHPGDRERIEKSIHSYGTKTTPIDFEYRIQRKDDVWRRWYNYAVPVLSPSVRPRKWVGISKDITEQKLAEEEKLKLEEQLRQAHKMEALGTLAGGIAHDFNNILSAIIGYAELSQIELPESSMAGTYIEEVLHASDRAKKLVHHILSFSRMEAKAAEPVQIGLIAREALKLLRATIPANIEFKTDVDTRNGITMANPTQIHQVILNLCTNASQAMESDGGTLIFIVKSIELTADSLAHLPEWSQARAGAYIKMTVADTGPGIASEHIDRIFDPYFTTKETGKGSGMGLAVVHGIVNSSHGFIEVESGYGHGAAFHVYLPELDHCNEPPALPRAATPVEHRGDVHILIVDDEKGLVEINKKRLQRLGYTVTAKTRSIEALELFRSRPDAFDLVVTDQTMPKMTGEQLAREMLTIRPDIPIILCTGFSSKVNEDYARAMGIRAFVMKPIQYEAFARTIRQVLDSSFSRN